MAKVRANPKFQINGITEAGYYVYTYIAGTATPKDTYTDNTETVANTNPIILDSRGEADVWWSGTYKVAVYTGDKDVDGVLVWSVDDYGEGEDQVFTGEFNLVNNGSFEIETIPDEPDDWTIVDYSTGVHTIDATDQFHGLNSLKFTSVGDGGGYATSDYFEVQEAKEVLIDWAMRSSVATVRNVVDIIWYTSAKTAISTTNIYDDSSTNPTAWTAKNGTATPPSTARYAQFRVYGCHSSDPTSGSTWIDNIVITSSFGEIWTANNDGAASGLSGQYWGGKEISKDWGTVTVNTEIQLADADLHIIEVSASITLTFGSSNTNDKASIAIHNTGSYTITPSGIDNNSPTFTVGTNVQDFLGLIKSHGKITAVAFVDNETAT